MVRRASRLGTLISLLAGMLAGLVAGCIDRPADRFANATPAPPPVPPNAIPAGDDIYYVPLPEPVQGCRAYRPFSQTRAVTAAIYFRTSDGRFVLDHTDAVCD